MRIEIHMATFLFESGHARLMSESNRDLSYDEQIGFFPLEIHKNIFEVRGLVAPGWYRLLVSELKTLRLRDELPISLDIYELPMPFEITQGHIDSGFLTFTIDPGVLYRVTLLDLQQQAIPGGTLTYSCGSLSKGEIDMDASGSCVLFGHSLCFRFQLGSEHGLQIVPM